jgi:Cu(I)/Ag(I) efflux system membrane fusion protein
MNMNKVERASRSFSAIGGSAGGKKQAGRLLYILILLTLLTGCGKETQQTTSGRYACPMLCVITDHPGECPVCGMEMAGGQSGSAAGRNSIELSESAIQLSAIRTAPAAEAVPQLEIPMVGKVVPDETRTAIISAWTDGRIDRLFADSTGIEIKRGDKLAELYSPALINAQQELIQAVQHNDKRMENILREKLRRRGIDKNQIEKIANRTEPLERLAITAPATGTVLSKHITEGETVKRGQPLYRIADLSNVWIELQAYETDLPQIKAGQMVMLEPGGLHGTVDFINPAINPQTRTAGLRVSAANPAGALRPDMLIRGTVHVPGDREEILIPASAPLITGERALVYVEIGENVFEGREVTLGPRAGDQIIIANGIDAGDIVVVNGAFRIDAAMQISGRASMMNTKPSDTPAMPATHQH